MKIAFITSLLSDWGGSEMMWYLTAKKAIKENDTIFVSVYEQETYHSKIIELKACSKFQARSNEVLISKSSYLKRILYKFKKNTHEQNIVKELNDFNPDKIVISLSNTFDIIWHSQIETICNSFPNKIILQSNFNDEHRILSGDEIARINKIVTKVSKIIFASTRNFERFQHQIARKLPLDIIEIIQAPTNYKISNISPLQLNPEMSIRFCIMSRFDLSLKGHDIVIQILASQQWKERNWVLNLYGDGEDIFYLKQLIKFYDLEDRVIFKGYSSNLENEWLINDILLLPSIGEGTPIVLMIAMMCSRPSIVTNVAGHSELITEDINGFIANGPDVFSYSNAMEKAWKRKDYWHDMGINSRAIAVKLLNENPELSLYNLIKSEN